MAEPILGIPLTLADRVHQIFPTLTKAQIARIAGHGRKRHVQSGETLLDLGDQLRFFVVTKGKLDIFGVSDSNESLIVTLQPGQFTGEVNLLSGRRGFTHRSQLLPFIRCCESRPMSDRGCSHLDAIAAIKQPERRECEECIKIASYWVHLRTCQTCGVTLCCDSSPNRHASKHARATGHPVIVSAQPGERWLYCYPDDTFCEY